VPRAAGSAGQESGRPKAGPVERAVAAELKALGKRVDDAGPSLPALAVALARKIDDPRTPAGPFADTAKELRDTLDRLRELVPPEAREDHIDQLEARAAKKLRLVGGAGA